jgi:NitT/TauT family transport system substrate-binding protein
MGHSRKKLPGRHDMTTPPKASGHAGGHPSWQATLAVAALVASLVVAALVAVPTGGPDAGRAPDKLTLAVSSTPHAALLHLAAAEGYFADERLDVSLALVSHGKAAVDRLADGSADFAAAAEVPFVIGVLQGQPLRVVASMLSTSREMAIVARRDRGIASPSDLAGKRIGVTHGTSGDYFVWAFLIRHKLPPERVTLVDVAPGAMVDALARGKVDAASLWQPLRRAAEAALGDKGVSFLAPDAYTVTHVVIGRADMLQARPRVAEKLVRALLRAEAATRARPGDALAIVARRLKLDARDLRADWQVLDFRVDLRQSQLVAWEDQCRWAAARGHASPGGMPDFLEHLHLDAVETLRPERMTVVH